MTPDDSFFAHWYFHVPNLALAAMIYTLIARFLLSLIFGLDSDRVIMRVFRTLSDPVLRVVGWITPRVVPNGLLLVFAVVWLLGARVGLYLAFALAGLRPGLGG
ncbi:MAG: hypothetical protein JNM13_13300 [Hyphomicrobiaceae bacterium]|nr:hypothetical protein [Hyphomicrobiaceae bacterium]